MLTDHIPPQSLEAERAALGAALISRAAADLVVSTLQGEDFYLEAHRRVFAVLGFLLSREIEPDMLTVPAELQNRDEFDQIGGQPYISEMIESVPTAAHAGYYAGIIREKAKRRRLLEASYRIQAAAQDEGLEVADVVSQAEALVYHASQERGTGEFVTASQQAVEAVDWLHAEPEARKGVTTGFWPLDQALGGWKDSRLYLVAGRPGAGKTAAAGAFLLAAAKAGTPTAMFSLEMERHDLWARLLAMTARVDGMKVEAGEFTDGERERVNRANLRLGELPIFLNDQRELTLLQVRGHARRLVRQHKIGLILVDYLQLIQAERRQEADHRHYTAVAEGLKSMSRELRVPVVALAQLSRATERREEKRPVPADLRESGGLEQAADAILLLYRENYHLRQLGKEVPSPDETEFIIGKARQSRVGVVRLAYHPEYLLFAEQDRHHEAPAAPARPLDYLREQRGEWGGESVH